MTYSAAQERSERSRRRLAKSHGPLLRRWAGARRAAWNIDRSWTVEDLLKLIEARRTNTQWEKLDLVPEDIGRVDRHVQLLAGCLWGEHRRPPELPPELSINEIFSRMQVQFPQMTRPKLRELLYRAAKTGKLRRIQRGTYTEALEDWDRWDDLNEVDEEEEKWWVREQRRRHACMNVLFVHYVLAHLSAYGKARYLGVSNRTYYDRLASALDELEGRLHMCTRKGLTE